MDLRWLRLLVELDERGSLRAAAEATGYSTSAVSQQLAGLQRSLGAELAERSGRGIRLTPAGRALLPAARQILAGMDAARGVVGAGSAPGGTVRVAGFATALAGPVARAVRTLAADYPDLTVQLEEREPREVEALLAADDIDVGVVYDYSLVPRYQPDGDQVRLLDEVPMHLVLPAGTDRPPDEVLRDPTVRWITNSRGSDDDELLHRVCATRGGVPQIGSRIDSLPLITELVVAGLGVALLVADGPRHPGVRYVDLFGAAGSRRIYACTRPGRSGWRNNAAFLERLDRSSPGL